MSKAVRMTASVAGGWQEGGEENSTWVDWPPVGEVIVLSDDQADHEVAAGRAEYVEAEKRHAESRPAPDTAEKRTVSKSAKDPHALRP